MRSTPTLNNSAPFRGHGVYAFLPPILPRRGLSKRSLPFTLLTLIGLIGQMILPIAPLTAQNAATSNEAEAESAVPAGVQYEADYKPDELLVAFRPGTASGRVESARTGIAAERIRP